MGRILLVLASMLVGCRDDACTLVAPITPGCGVVDGEAEIRLGDPAAAVEAALGGFSEEGDLGLLGTRFAGADRTVSGRLVDGVVEAVTVHEGFTGTTAGGLGVGSPTDAIVTEFGEPVVDPFTHAWVYAGTGLTVELEQLFAVERIQVTPKRLD